uniref:Uncharacterized protein n=1 Tax=Anguilla anguilla TaxID=7936 RepID=A0A0E9SPJ2_ANGAN
MSYDYTLCVGYGCRVNWNAA